MALKVGDKIPEILGYDQTGKELKREDFKGKKLVLYFYPKDEIIGVSKDNEKSHQKFIEKQSLPFSLIADTEVRLNQEFGVWAEKKMAGRSYMGTLRTTFLIDENGIIERVIEKVNTKEHAAQILNGK